MRIVCEKCASAYLIDDRLIRPKGIRAQCPRCKHLQLVKRVGGADVPPAPSKPAPSVSPAGGDEDLGNQPTQPYRMADIQAMLQRAAPGPEAPQPPPPPPGSDEPSLPPAPVEPEPPPAVAPLSPPPPPEPPAPRVEPLAAPPVSESPAPVPEKTEDLANQVTVPPSSPLPPSPETVAESVRISVVPKRSGGARVGRWVIGGVALFALGGGAAYFLTTERAPAPDAELEKTLSRWKAAYPEVTASESELLLQGHAKLAEDTRAGYQEAESLFAQAVVKNPRGADGLEGHVESVALGRGSSLDAAAHEQLTALARLAVERSGRKPSSLVALADVLLAGGAANQDEAKRLAEEAAAAPLGASSKDVQLLLGRVLLATSSDDALTHLNRAVELDENFRRAYDVRAQLHVQRAELSAALADWERRLTLDPEHFETAQHMGALYENVGETAKARKLYERLKEKRAVTVPATLALAVLKYQLEGKASEAAAALRGLIKGRDKLDDATLALTGVHLASAERLAGNASASDAAAQAALSVEPKSPGAHLQLLFAALEQGLAKPASQHYGFVQGKLADAALESVLAGRIRYLEDDLPGAAAAFAKATELDGRRVDARVWTAVVALASKHPPDAERVLETLLTWDPTRGTLFEGRHAFGSADALRGAEVELARLAPGKENTVPRMLEVLARFHLGELERSDKMLQDLRPGTLYAAPALALRALLTLNRGEKEPAKGLAKKALTADANAPWAHYAQGMTWLALSHPDDALRELQAAADAKLTLARVRVLELEGKANAAASVEALRKIVLEDPHNAAARRVLFQLEAGDKS